jgi:hypothetical protein
MATTTCPHPTLRCVFTSLLHARYVRDVNPLHSPSPDPIRRIDVTGTLISYSRCLTVPWRTGRKVGRTVYAVDHRIERLILVADTPRLADHLVRLHNAWLQARVDPP